jgi:predicted MFS family arabinose efflux permease
VGPLLVTGVVAAFNIVAGLILMAMVFLGAALALMRVRELLPLVPGIGRTVALSRQIVCICALAVLMSMSLGLTEGNVPSRMGEYQLPAADAGLFLALLSVGSVVGGLIVSVRPIKSRRSARRASVLALVFAVSIVPSSLAQSGWLFGLLLPFVTLSFVPLSGLGAAEIESRLGTADRGRAFALYVGASQVGGGIGVTLNGVLLSVLPAARIPLVASGLLSVLAVSLRILSMNEDKKEGSSVGLRTRLE